jgi:hypothetical protein
VHLLERVFVTAVTLLVIAVTLHIAWTLVKPILIPIAVLSAVVTVLLVLWRRRSYW